MQNVGFNSYKFAEPSEACTLDTQSDWADDLSVRLC